MSLFDNTSFAPDDQHSLHRMRKRLAIRGAIMLAALAATGVLIYYRLGPLQPWLRPTAPPGGWVIDPPHLFRIFLAWYGPAFVAVPTIYRLKRRWNEQDSAAGAPTPQAVHMPLLVQLVCWLMICVFATLLLAAAGGYLFGFTTVSPNGVRVWRVVKYVDHPYSEVCGVTVLPAGFSRGNTATHGPMAWIHFRDGSDTKFGHENGLTQANVSSISQFVASQSRTPIIIDPTAQPR